MYIDRDEYGNVIARYAQQQREDQEFLEGAEIYIPENLKLTGIEFNGVMCSATKEDMWGLNSVKSWVIAGNDVDFEFDNGNVLNLTSDNYAEFESVWIPFRASFFK